jgi:WhiB family redox-sensing transcriptional regulator
VTDPDAGHGWHLWADPGVRDPWWHSAACAGHDPELFFPAHHERWKTRRAKQICNRCPVIEECRDYATPKRLLDGIWGGLTASERDRMRRANRRTTRR